MSKVVPKSDFMNVFDFDNNDLASNQNHQLTLHQLHKLRRMRLESIILPVVFFVLSFGAFVTVFYDFITRPYAFTSQPTLFIMFGFVAISIYLSISRWLRITKDLTEKKVKIVSGKVLTGAAETRNAGFYATGFRLTINGTVFIIPSKARGLFSDGKSYRLYFLPNSRIIVSVDTH